MRPRIYTDTSVIGGCFDEEFEKYSNMLFDEFVSGEKKLSISDLTLKELELAPRSLLDMLYKIPEKTKNIWYWMMKRSIYQINT